MVPESYLLMLPPKQQLELAAHLEQQAHALRQAAENQQRKIDAREKAKRHRDKLASTRQMFKAYLYQGYTLERARAMTAAQSAMPDALLDAWSKAIPKEIEREKRNRAIMQKAALGWIDKEIADHYGLHEKSVTRIIGQMRRHASDA